MNVRRQLNRSATAALFALSLLSLQLRGDVLDVPGAFPTIKSAVRHASDGDTVLVDDGVYLEKNIEVRAKILVKSRNLFGATIYGPRGREEPIFRIGAEARIEGFILRGGAVGIEQRDSPDVRWEAEKLLIIGCNAGFSINDREANVGSAGIRRVIIMGTRDSTGIATNDARDLSVSSVLILHCQPALSGYDHLSFRMRSTVVVDSDEEIKEGTAYRPVLPATSRIEIGEGFRALDRGAISKRSVRDEIRTFLQKDLLGTDALAGGTDRTAGEAIVDLVMADILRTSGDFGAASESYERAQASGERIGNNEIVWQALWGSVLNQEGRNSPESVRRMCRRAVEHLERWVPTIPAGVYASHFLDDKTRVFDLLLDLLYEQNAEASREEADREAFLYAEKAKCLSRLFPSNGGIAASRGISKGDGSREEAEKNLATAQLELQNPRLEVAGKAALIKRLETAEDDLNAVLVGEERNWIRENRRNPEPLDGVLGIDDACRRLGGIGALSYFLGEKRSFLFFLTHGGLRVFDLPGESEIMALVGPYLRILQVPEGKGFLTVRAGRSVYDLLVGQVTWPPGEAPRRLMIVPDGQLFYLPFETLIPPSAGDPGSAADEKTKFWVDSVEISYAASVSAGLMGGSETRARSSASLLAIGSSSGVECDNRAPNARRSFLPLSQVGREIAAVSSRFDPKRSVLLRERGANERSVKEALAFPHDIIHIAAHGVIDDSRWWRSALLLGPSPSMGEDGFLTSLEIAGLQLDSYLVVLSGCGTGLGSIDRGEGLLGLGGSFMNAGARNLVVSLWNVDDKATARLMSAFYGFLASGDPPDRALARAKLDLIRGGIRNPYYWAPFVLISRHPT